MFEKLPSLLAYQPQFYHGGPIGRHLPFLYDLVANAKPKLVVTIGFGNGEAFFTLCQAVLEQGIEAQCLAVPRDAGRASEDRAWREGIEHANKFYPRIALLRTVSSAELIHSLGERSVDLLLIDDCDAGSLIARDLAAWTAKLAPHAIVLVHGIELRRDDHPRAAWCNFSEGRETAEVNDGIGLGITRCGHSTTDLFVEWFGLPAAEVRTLHQLAWQRAQAEVAAQEGARKTAAFEVQNAWLHSVLVKDADVREFIQSISATTTDLRQKVEPLQRDRAKAQLIMDAQAEQLATWAAQLEAVRNERDKLKAQVEQQKARMNAAKLACRKNGNCFRGPLVPQPKQRRPVGERIVREVNRWPRKLRSLLSPAAVPGEAEQKIAAPEPAVKDRYDIWIEEHEPDSAALAEQRRISDGWSDAPKISLLLPVYETPVVFLDALLESLVAQSYKQWELCLVDAGSSRQETRAAVEEWRARDPRIRVTRLNENRGIAGNTNAALAMASGSYITCIDHDDTLAPFALFEVASAVRTDPAAEILYSDEDRLTETGRRHSPFFKPEWSPALLTSSMYLGHLMVYRRELIDSLGGWRKEFDLSQDYDLALRATDEPRRIAHIPHVLYHWREHAASGSAGGKPDARKSNLAALADAMRRRNLPAEVLEYPTANRARMKFTRMPKASIIIPTDSPVRARHCMEHLLATTDYPDFEIIIVTNSKLAEVLMSAKPAGAAVHCVVFDEPFNFSAKCNAGANAATGDRLIFFNDDVEASQRDWIQELIEPLENPQVGAVAPKLLYETGKIQHAGLVTGVRGLVGTAFHQWPVDSTDYTNMAQSLRDVSALSGACLAMRRKDFVELGEWDAVNTPIAHSDLDLCFKVREAGMRCVYTPFATLTHRGHESIGWEKTEDEPRAVDKASVYLLKRWAGYATHDPFFPANMRDWLYADSPTPLQMWGRNERARRDTRADLLFVSHDLTWSGAPLILLEMAKWCRARGFFVTLMSPEDGPLRERIVAEGIPLIVDPLVTKSHPSFAELARQFDCVIASTIFGAPIVNAAKAAGIPHLWWIHEGRVAENYFDQHAAIRTAIALADLVVTPDTRSAQVYQPFREQPIRVLPYGIEDPRGESVEGTPRDDGPVTFLLLGSVEHRKGHEIFLDALRMLAPEVTKDARFEIVGRPHDPALTRKVERATEEIANLTYHGGVSPEEALEFVRKADVVVCASWDETGPLMLIEALACGKPIVSTKVGAVSEHVKDEGVGIFVEPGNARELAAALGRMVQEREQLAPMGARAREAYERFFTFRRFGEGFEALVDEVISTNRGATQLPTLDRAAR